MDPSLHYGLLCRALPGTHVLGRSLACAVCRGSNSEAGRACGASEIRQHSHLKTPEQSSTDSSAVPLPDMDYTSLTSECNRPDRNEGNNPVKPTRTGKHRSKGVHLSNNPQCLDRTHQNPREGHDSNSTNSSSPSPQDKQDILSYLSGS